MNHWALIAAQLSNQWFFRLAIGPGADDKNRVWRRPHE